MAQVRVGDISNEDPSDLEHTLPLIGRPNGAAPRVVHLVRSDHQ